jgi:hypothetical protein
MPPPSSSRGRGLPILDSLADDWASPRHSTARARACGSPSPCQFTPGIPRRERATCVKITPTLIYPPLCHAEMVILPGSVSGTCHVDGQDEGARRNDGEQHNSPGHHADVRHVTQVAVREGKNTVEPPDWRQRHGGPRQSGQSLGRVRPRLQGGHVDVTGQVPTIRVARFGGPGPEAKVTILDSPGNRPSRLGVPGRHGVYAAPTAGRSFVPDGFPPMLVCSRLRWASALPLRRQSPGIRGRGCRRVPLIPSAATGNVASFSEADAAVDGRLIRLSAYPHRLVTGTLGSARIGEFCASV